MTSPYITEAMRRRELPVDVRCIGPKSGWSITRPGTNCYYDHQTDATRAYLAAINELSKEG